MKTICIGARSQSGVTGLPPNVTPFKAALMLAVNIWMRSRIRQIPARERNIGIEQTCRAKDSEAPVT